MHDLLSAGFYRLFRSRAFWIVLAVTAANETMMILLNWSNVRRYQADDVNLIAPFDELMMQYGFYIMLGAAVLIPLLIGGDYSDGTLRNRLMTGHSRPAVYAASYLVAAGGMLSVAAADIAVSCTLGAALLGNPAHSLGRLLFLLAVSLLTVLSFCAVFTLVSMLTPNRAAALIGCFALMVLLFYVGQQLADALHQEEFWRDYVVSGSDGYVQYDYYPNPAYVSGTKRQIYLFFYDLLPFTQIFELAVADPYVPMTGNPVRMMFCSLGVMAVSTAGGMAAFRRKDIR